MFEWVEKKFNIKIDRGELIPTEKLDDPKYVQDGKLTADGLAMLAAASWLNAPMLTGALPDLPPPKPMGIFSCEGGTRVHPSAA